MTEPPTPPPDTPEEPVPDGPGQPGETRPAGPPDWGAPQPPPQSWGGPQPAQTWDAPPPWPQSQPTPPPPWPQPQPVPPSGWPPGISYQGPWEQLGPPVPPPPPRRRGRTVVIAAIAAVVLVGGGVTTYVAMSDSNSGFRGAASPQAAIVSLVDDLNKSDVLGLLDHLPPGERDSLVGPIRESISQAKRLHILRPDADGSKIAGLSVTASNLGFEPNDETVNDHVKIVKVTGGSVTINGDLTKVPFTAEYLKIAFPNGLPTTTGGSRTVDLGALDRENGRPVRLAAVRVNGKWYPSLLYTIADAIVHDAEGSNPTPADYVAPKGAPSPEDAVKQALMAISTQDDRRLIELVAPDALQVLHDYGGLLLKNAQRGDQSFTIKDIRLMHEQVSGATRVTLQGITFDVPDQEVTVRVTQNCLEVTTNGDYRKLCADDVAKQVASSAFPNKTLTADEQAALRHLAEGIPNIGLDVTSVDGQWYIDPVRSYLDLTNAVAASLQGNDLLVLIHLVLSP